MTSLNPFRGSQESEGFLNEVCDEEERLNLAPHRRDMRKGGDLQAEEGIIQLNRIFQYLGPWTLASSGTVGRVLFRPRRPYFVLVAMRRH